MFETGTFGPCLVRRLKWREGGHGPPTRLPSGYAPVSRSNWWKIAGRSGAQSVCACTINKNVTLMLSVVSINGYYRDIIQMYLCNVTKQECMFGRCE